MVGSTRMTYQVDPSAVKLVAGRVGDESSVHSGHHISFGGRHFALVVECSRAPSHELFGAVFRLLPCFDEPL